MKYEIDRSFYAEHDVFIESVLRMVHNQLAPQVEHWERQGHFPDEVFKTLGEQGFLGLMIPEEYGGSSGDHMLASAWCEAFGELRSVGLTVGVNMHSLVVSKALAALGNDELKRHWLPRAVTGEAIGAYAFTEPGCGSDLANLSTKAERRGSKWVLNGAKTFITNGARADFILVLARTNAQSGYGGFTTFVVDTSLKGFKVQRKLDKLGWRASDTAEMTFEDLELDDGCILGKEGEGWRQATANLNWERVMLTLTALGGGRACFRDAIRYATDRKAFGKSIIEHEVVGERLAEMHRRLVAGEALSHHAVRLVASGQPARAEVSIAKKLVCDDMVWLADQAIQIHGGYGYTTEFSAERWWRDLRLMPIGGGTSEIMANVVAKELKWS